MVQKKGRPSTLVVKPEVDEQLERQRRMGRFWQTVECIGERDKDLDPDEELAFITDVVGEVRRERYERDRRVARERR